MTTEKTEEPDINDPEVVRRGMAATTHPDYLWKAKEWIQDSDKKVAAT